jgi:hypothetical protein
MYNKNVNLDNLLGYWNQSLPDKVDYADLVCAPAFAYGYEFVYEDEYGYMVKDTIKALEKLKEYETLIGQGKIPKYHIGDSIYFRVKGWNQFHEYVDFIQTQKISNIDINEYGIMYSTASEKFMINDIGKTIFLTKEEAEMELNKL